VPKVSSVGASSRLFGRRGSRRSLKSATSHMSFMPRAAMHICRFLGRSSRFCSNSVLRLEENLALYVQHHGRTMGVLTAGTGDYYLSEGGRLVTSTSCMSLPAFERLFLAARSAFA